MGGCESRDRVKHDAVYPWDQGSVYEDAVQQTRQGQSKPSGQVRRALPPTARYDAACGPCVRPSLMDAYPEELGCTLWSLHAITGFERSPLQPVPSTTYFEARGNYGYGYGP